MVRYFSFLLAMPKHFEHQLMKNLSFVLIIILYIYNIIYYIILCNQDKAEQDVFLIS